MTFEEILDQAIAMLQRRGRLTYSTLYAMVGQRAQACTALTTAIEMYRDNV
jgi:hypothetical protein